MLTSSDQPQTNPHLPGSQPLGPPASGEASAWAQAFCYAPVALRVEDFSAVRRRLDGLRASGVRDLGAYLRSHPELVLELARSVRVLGINDATGRLAVAGGRGEGSGLADLFGDGSPEVFLGVLLSLAEGGAPLHPVVAHRHAPEGDRHVQVAAALPPGGEAAWARVYLAVTDVTPLAEAERASRAGEERYRALFAASPHPTLVVDAESGVVFDGTEGAASLLEVSPPELVGRFLGEVCSRADDLLAVGGDEPDPGPRTLEGVRWGHRGSQGRRTRVIATRVGSGGRPLVALWLCLAPAPCQPPVRAGARADGALAGAPRPGGLAALSPRELEVLARIGRGETTDAISRALSISPKTVETHRSRLFQKLGVRKSTDLVRLALHAGLGD